MSEDKNLRELLLRANKDPAFRTKFLANPEAIAKEANVKLKPEFAERIKKASAFIDSLDDIRLPPGPIYYPIDGILQRWKLKEVLEIARENYLDKIDWIRYPVGPIIREKLREVEKGF
ncbi:MAG: hypothetical protein ACM3UN_01910 [Bacillota bacterium]